MKRAPRKPSRVAVAKSLSELAVLWKKSPPEKDGAQRELGADEAVLPDQLKAEVLR